MPRICTAPSNAASIIEVRPVSNRHQPVRGSVQLARGPVLRAEPALLPASELDHEQRIGRPRPARQHGPEALGGPLPRRQRGVEQPSRPLGELAGTVDRGAAVLGRTDRRAHVRVAVRAVGQLDAPVRDPHGRRLRSEGGADRDRAARRPRRVGERGIGERRGEVVGERRDHGRRVVLDRDRDPCHAVELAQGCEPTRAASTAMGLAMALAPRGDDIYAGTRFCVCDRRWTCTG